MVTLLRVKYVLCPEYSTESERERGGNGEGEKLKEIKT